MMMGGMVRGINIIVVQEEWGSTGTVGHPVGGRGARRERAVARGMALRLPQAVLAGDPKGTTGIGIGGHRMGLRCGSGMLEEVG